MIRRPLFTVALTILLLLCASCAEEQPSYVTGRCAISPDGSTVFFRVTTGSNSDIWSIGSNGSGLTKLTGGPMSKNSPWPSPDGRSIVYVASDDRTCHICVMDRDGRNSRQLTTSDRSDFGPSYSPDGSKIIFARAARHRPMHWGGWTWDQWDIWQINADGSSPRQLTFSRYYSIDEPYFSPDGKHVLFAAEFGEPFVSESHQLLTFDIGHDGSAVNLRPVLLPPQPEKRKYDGDPSFSPEGSRILFTSLRVSRESPYDYEIWTAGIDGTNLHQITHNRSRNQNPISTPDGKSIYFTISGLDLYGLWRMRADGSDARQLIDHIPAPNDPRFR